MTSILKTRKPAGELSSYRPGSLNSAACKAMDAPALVQLTWVAHAHGFLADQQTGFRRRRYTADSIAVVVSTLEDAKAGADIVLLLLIDVHGASDSLPHAVVQQAPDFLGMCGNLLKFLASFLSNRTITTLQSAREDLQLALGTAATYLCSIDLTISARKAKAMLLHPRAVAQR
ncbi:uncharacterized protein [Dermacentor albipictus]|uniref:uncharacterized protein n=1 Tax=Dermacentor albipictus TaxID=60249 RepID=UPI0038FD3EC6